MRLLSSIVRFFRVGFDEFLSHAPYPILSDIAIHSSIRRLYKTVDGFCSCCIRDIVARDMGWPFATSGCLMVPRVHGRKRFWRVTPSACFLSRMYGKLLPIATCGPPLFQYCIKEQNLVHWISYAIPTYPSIWPDYHLRIHSSSIFQWIKVKKNSPLSINWAWFLGLWLNDNRSPGAVKVEIEWGRERMGLFTSSTPLPYPPISFHPLVFRSIDQWLSLKTHNKRFGSNVCPSLIRAFGS